MTPRSDDRRVPTSRAGSPSATRAPPNKNFVLHVISVPTRPSEIHRRRCCRRRHHHHHRRRCRRRRRRHHHHHHHIIFSSHLFPQT